MVRRRHVFYITGYDPQGVDGYHRLFQRELKRSLKIWPITAEASEPETDADGIAARWQVDAAGPDWRVATTYELLRWDDLVAADTSRAMPWRMVLAVGCFFQQLFNGTIFRLFAADARYAGSYLYALFSLFFVLTLPIAFGLVVHDSALEHAAPWPFAILLGVAAWGVSYWVIYRLAKRGFVFRLTDAWIWVRDWAGGKRPDVEARVDTFARRVIERQEAGDADEILVVGHSIGAAVAIATVARALAIRSDLGKSGTPLIALTLGSSLPLAALHRGADAIRDAIRRVALAEGVTWVDAQAQKDVINFQKFDPVGGVGINLGTARNNPTVWQVRFRELIFPEAYNRFRRNFMRMHFQFIMANDRRGPYDYFAFICGPAPFLDWPRGVAAAAFAPGGGYRSDVQGADLR